MGLPLKDSNCYPPGDAKSQIQVWRQDPAALANMFSQIPPLGLGSPEVFSAGGSLAQ